ncbi:MAG: ribbon-helix-helix protein, CopG family [Candidatus Spyradosoma sp.]
MSSKPSMGIRLDPEDRKTLEELAERWRLNASDIVRLAVKSLLDDAKRNGGKIELPYTFKTRERRGAAARAETVASK